jgi:hypothetical protein
MTSWALLHFTEVGLYLQIGPIESKQVYAEGMVESNYDKTSVWLDFFGMVSIYSRRTLIHQTDVLRAFSGILTALYGTRTSFSMP